MPGRIPEDEGQDVSDEEIQKPSSDAGLCVMYPRHPFVPDDDSALFAGKGHRHPNTRINELLPWAHAIACH
jgi:hypothetical protein